MNEETLSRTTYRQMKVQLKSAWGVLRRYEQDRVEKVEAAENILRLLETGQIAKAKAVIRTTWGFDKLTK